MRLNRTLLYTGVFLLAIGGAFVAAEAGAFAAVGALDVLRLWPLAIIAIGLAITLRRTPVSLASGVLAVAVPGLVLGSAIALAPRLPVMNEYWWDRMHAAYERYHCAELGARLDFGDVEIDPTGGCS